MRVSDRRYAEGTTVSPEKSLGEIKRALRRFGADAFAQSETNDGIALMFVINHRQPNQRNIKFWLPLPTPESLSRTATGKERSENAVREARDKETTRLWRSLVAAIKGKLIAVDDGIESIEEAFYAHVLLPNGQTIHEETKATVQQAYERQLMPSVPLVALPPGKERL